MNTDYSAEELFATDDYVTKEVEKQANLWRY